MLRNPLNSRKAVMKLIIISLTLISLSLSSYAQRTNFINLNKFITPDADQYNDIAHLSFISNVNETTKVDEAISVEVYFGEFEDNYRGHQKLKYIRDVIDLDKKSGKRFNFSTVALSPEIDTLKSSRKFENFLNRMKLEKKDVNVEKVPHFLDYTTTKKKLKKRDRIPSAKVNGKVFWTLVRGTSAAGGTFAGLYFMEGLSASLAATISILPAIASGSLTYFSAPIGNFFTSGRWSTWLIESQSYVANKFRRVFNITQEKIEAGLAKNKKYLKSVFPDVSTETSKSTIIKLIQAKKLSKLKNVEQYFKWWLTEVAFTGVAIKLPLAVAGIGAAPTALNITGDILLGSTLGMLAQGPGDIAIQLRKYQKVNELKEGIISGKIKVEKQKDLLKEIEKVLDTTGKNKGYNINGSSHPRLLRIENWSRSRATLLSFFAVAGVGMEVAGIPAAKPLLIAVGAWGAGYYANVQGWFRPEKLLRSTKLFLTGVRQNGLKYFSLGPIDVRQCSGVYMLKELAL